MVSSKVAAEKRKMFIEARLAGDNTAAANAKVGKKFGTQVNGDMAARINKAILTRAPLEPFMVPTSTGRRKVEVPNVVQKAVENREAANPNKLLRQLLDTLPGSGIVEVTIFVDGSKAKGRIRRETVEEV